MPIMTYQQLVVFWPFSMILCEAVEESGVASRFNFKSLNMKKFIFVKNVSTGKVKYSTPKSTQQEMTSSYTCLQKIQTANTKSFIITDYKPEIFNITEI